MKKLVECLPQLLTNLCISFTVATLVFTAFDYSKETMRRERIYEMLLICAVATVLQYILFSGNVVKRLSYLWRMVLFALVLLPVIALCAVTFRWFPTGQVEDWIVFAGCFLAGYVIISLVFEVGFRLRRKVYDDALGRYKKDRNK